MNGLCLQGHRPLEVPANHPSFEPSWALAMMMKISIGDAPGEECDYEKSFYEPSARETQEQEGQRSTELRMVESAMFAIASCPDHVRSPWTSSSELCEENMRKAISNGIKTHDYLLVH